MAGLIRPITVDPSMFSARFPVMIVSALVLALVVYVGNRVTRSEGIVAVLLYAAYAVYLYMSAVGSPVTEAG